jgi:NAD kinase
MSGNDAQFGGIENIVVINKDTALEELMHRHTTRSQVKYYLESRGQSLEEYVESHKRYISGVDEVISAIPIKMRYQAVHKKYLHNFIFGNKDLVVVIGGDGLFVNAAKYTNGQSIILVNPDAQRHDGVLASCGIANFDETLKSALQGKAATRKLTMAKASLNDGQAIYAVNDLFVGKSNHSSARYSLAQSGASEQQSSSGIIISTGTGSTGWRKSIITGAYGICGRGLPGENDYKFNPESDELVYMVREPFITRVTSANRVHGAIQKKQPLLITSYMPENGVIFSDGIEEDCLAFNSGMVATITPSQKKIMLVKMK